MALTYTELDRMSCENPVCTHENDDIMVLASRCHPQAGVIVRYLRQTHVMAVACKKCDRPICEVAVAKTQL